MDARPAHSIDAPIAVRFNAPGVRDRLWPVAYPFQAYLLARSLIELGGVAPERITAHLVHAVHASVERTLAGLGVSTRWVEPFDTAVACATSSIGSDLNTTPDTTPATWLGRGGPAPDRPVRQGSHDPSGPTGRTVSS